MSDGHTFGCVWLSMPGISNVSPVKGAQSVSVLCNEAGMRVHAACELGQISKGHSRFIAWAMLSCGRLPTLSELGCGQCPQGQGDLNSTALI